MTKPGPAPREELVAAAKGGDESAFTALVEPHRRELHVHCYRMLGSFEAAEDQVQETFMRAWRGRERFEGGRLFRAWLYRIATNACRDACLRCTRSGTYPGSSRTPTGSSREMAPREAEPDAVVVARETIELTFIAVIQTLPPRQRAVLILRDVLEWSARETAALLEMSVPAANSALQRARQTVQELRSAERLERSAEDLTEQERRLLQGFIDTHERGDAAAAAAMVADDIRITMPPHPFLFEGREAMALLLERAFGPETPGDWLLVPTRANRQPTAASYLRQPGDSEYRAFKFDVLRVEGGVIAEVTTFDASLFDAFGLPPTWPEKQPS